MEEEKKDRKEVVNISYAANSMEWGSASKGTKHKVYWEDEEDGKNKIKIAKELEIYKSGLFPS